MAEAVTVEREATSSIELDRNARGDYAWKIKVYFEAVHLDALLSPDAEALEIIRRIDQRLRIAYDVR